MRTKEQFENERYYGIQKFTDPYDAFSVMSGKWCKEYYGYKHTTVFVLDDQSFKTSLLLRAIKKYTEYKCKRIEEQECLSSLGIGNIFENYMISDYLVRFDFIFYSKITKCYYTSRMTCWEDDVNLWNDRQWGYFDELYMVYDFDEIAKKAIDIVDRYFNNNPKAVEGDPADISYKIEIEENLRIDDVVSVDCLNP